MITVLYGCNEPTPFSAQDYTGRLARVLKEPVPDLFSSEEIEFPRRRDLQVSFQSHSIDLLEFLTLKDCELQKIVAERNSSLGRLALPSQQLVSELRFLKTGATCLSILKDETFADELTAVLLEKQEELAGRIWQATLAGPEFRAFWRFRSSACSRVCSMKNLLS